MDRGTCTAIVTALCNSMNDGAPRLDIGVDPMGFVPVAYEEVAAILKDRAFTPYDHHIIE